MYGAAGQGAFGATNLYVCHPAGFGAFGATYCLRGVADYDSVLSEDLVLYSRAHPHQSPHQSLLGSWWG